MSRFHDEQQPSPALGPAPESHIESHPAASHPPLSAGSPEFPEPRLLTRAEAPDAPARGARRRARRQHDAEDGLGRWSRRLAARRTGPKPSRSRRGRWLVWTGVAVVVLLCVAALVLVLDLRHSLWASLPQLDGELHIPGLHAPVTVTRDPQGVPSITATNLDDLLFAQGYITAGDRLWQMDALRRHAAGELAEILGPGLVEHDRRQRILQLRATADRAVAQLPPDQLAQLEAYARGVNAYIAAHGTRLPVEFRLLAYKPAPWSPRDSLLVSLAMWQDLTTEFPQKLNREALSAHLPADLLPDLYPVGSWRDQPPAAQSPNLTTPRIIEQVPLDPSQSRWQPPATPAVAPLELLAVSRTLPATGRCTACRVGSNNWAVSGSHTASGAPLVSNDMHLGLAIPDIWYEAALHTDLAANTGPGDRLDVTGFTLPGVPFVIVGRNPHVAWGVTNLGADVQDLRLEHLRGAGQNTEYERQDGSWTLADHHPERIHVRGGRDVLLDVLTTTHAVGATEMQTPIISALYPSERRALSLAWTAYDPSAVNSPFLGVDTATDGPALVAAFASFGGPSLNLVWGDDAGHIGYHALGLIPVRGPAVQHPRADATPAPGTTEPGTPLPTDGDEPPPTDGPQASTTESRPHLVLSAFRPIRPRRHVSRAPGRAAARLRGPKIGRHGALPPAAPAEEPIALPPPPLNYTVGSPISPLPVDALDAAQAWSGYIRYSDLPALTDPPGGFLATANARITPDDYPWAVADDWPDPFRVERIVHLLSGRQRLTPADMLRMQNDVHSDVNRAMAQRVAYAIDHASAHALGSDARRLRQAADLLRDWNGEMTISSPGAALITAVRDLLWPSLLVPQIVAHDASRANRGSEARQAATLAQLYTWNESTTALELLLQNQPARWLPKGVANWNDFLAAVTERSLKVAGAPADLATWHYGQIHTVELTHPVFGGQRLLSDLLGIRGTTGQQPAPGDGTTIKAIGRHFGPSERFTADLSSPDAALGNITTGESGNGRSPWYLDQFRPWLAGTTFPLPDRRTRATHTLTLLPQ